MASDVLNYTQNLEIFNELKGLSPKLEEILTKIPSDIKIDGIDEQLVEAAKYGLLNEEIINHRRGVGANIDTYKVGNLTLDTTTNPVKYYDTLEQYLWENLTETRPAIENISDLLQWFGERTSANLNVNLTISAFGGIMANRLKGTINVNPYLLPSFEDQSYVIGTMAGPGLPPPQLFGIQWGKGGNAIGTDTEEEIIDKYLPTSDSRCGPNDGDIHITIKTTKSNNNKNGDYGISGSGDNIYINTDSSCWTLVNTSILGGGMVNIIVNKLIDNLIVSTYYTFEDYLKTRGYYNPLGNLHIYRNSSDNNLHIIPGTSSEQFTVPFNSYAGGGIINIFTKEYGGKLSVDVSGEHENGTGSYALWKITDSQDPAEKLVLMVYNENGNGPAQLQGLDGTPQTPVHGDNLTIAW